MTEAPFASCMLVVDSGPQTGASLKLAKGKNSVGRSLASDMVVIDGDLKEFHFEVEVGEHVLLSLLSGTICDDNGRLLDLDEPHRVKSLLRFKAGQTIFRLIVDPPAYPIVKLPRVVPLKAALGVTLAIGMFSVVFLSPPSEPKSFASSRLSIGPVVHVDHRSAAVIAPAIDSVIVAAAFSAQVSSIGLIGVSVASGGQGAIEAEGNITGDQKASWNAARRWFDAKYGAQFVLVDHLSSSTPSAPFSVAAVWAGPMPYMIDRNGVKLFVGSVVSDGWIIQDIKSEGVFLRRAGQLLIVHF